MFMDDFSKYIWYFPIKVKYEAFSIFSKFKVYVKKQLGCSIKQVQTDRGGEYRTLANFFESMGIHHRRSCPHTHKQQGAIERKHKHIIESGLALLAHANLPAKFWNFAFETASFLINRMPAPILNYSTPLQMLFKTQPDYTFLKIFGCRCYPLLRPYDAHKLSYRSKSCVFLGYSPHHLGYRCFDFQSGRIM